MVLNSDKAIQFAAVAWYHVFWIDSEQFNELNHQCEIVLILLRVWIYICATIGHWSTNYSYQSIYLTIITIVERSDICIRQFPTSAPLSPQHAASRTSVPPTLRFGWKAGRWPEKFENKDASHCAYSLCISQTQLGCKACNKSISPSSMIGYI